MSAGVKALSTWSMSTLLETCRMACGGHGYSNASGFSKIYCVAMPAATYEGENTVMMLQTARYKSTLNPEVICCGVRCSSMVGTFAHGAMGCRID